MIPANFNPMNNSTIVASAANFTSNYSQYTRPTGGIHTTASQNQWIQAALNDYFGMCLLDVDGIYGRKTRTLVSQFQDHFNRYDAWRIGAKLAVDGDFGPQTMRAFESLGY